MKRGKWRQVQAVQCPKCLMVLVSYSRHDFRTCGCPNQTMVDGGFDYSRYGGIVLPKHMDFWEKLA